MPRSSINFNVENGRASIHDGYIFFSPNCNRPVDIIPEHIAAKDPFKEPRLNLNMFLQPVWWSCSYGWLGFVPLAPSFLSAPFQHLSVMPQLEKTQIFIRSEDRYVNAYQMSSKDAILWKKREDMIVGAAEKIRIWHCIPGNMPPSPSSFQYTKPYRSLGTAKKMIHLARDWFVIWMGFLSYLITQTKNYPSYAYGHDSSCPLPSWYIRLRDKHNYPDYWLDDLLSSPIFNFDRQIQRVGVVVKWHPGRNRQLLEFLSSRHISLWCIWTHAEESDKSFPKNLVPPSSKLKEALAEAFNRPDIPLAGLLMHRYFQLGSFPINNATIDHLRLNEAPSYIIDFLRGIFVRDYSAIKQVENLSAAQLKQILQSEEEKRRKEAASAINTIPTQKMLPEHPAGKLYNNWTEFFERREKRQNELIAKETPRECQRRESLEKARPTGTTTTMYIWEKTGTFNGSQEMYVRVRVAKSEHADTYAMFRPSQRIYNACANEWDFCSDFKFDLPKDVPDISLEEKDDEEDGGNGDIDALYGFQVEEHHPASEERRDVPTQNFSDFLLPSLFGDSLLNSDELGPEEPLEDKVLSALKWGLGFVLPMVPVSGTTKINWESATKSLGYPSNTDNIAPNDRLAICIFLDNLVRDPKAPLPNDIHDLNDSNHLSVVNYFNFRHLSWPSPNLFVFSGPSSESCQWSLGVDSAPIALYVCRCIISNPFHTLITIAKLLLERGVRFRTLEKFHSDPRRVTIVEPFVHRSFRFTSYKFSNADFETSMLQAKSVLNLPQGRAALLYGGIVGRIAREFLSLDGALDGPSVEVTRYGTRYVSPPIKNGAACYLDDELTEKELAIICGTYSLYTATYQISIKTWFPTSEIWASHRNGLKWLEWTETDENFFRKRLNDIRHNSAQPLTANEWKDKLRGHGLTRKIFDSNDKRSTSFFDRALPLLHP